MSKTKSRIINEYKEAVAKHNGAVGFKNGILKKVSNATEDAISNADVIVAINRKGPATVEYSEPTGTTVPKVLILRYDDMKT